MRDGARWIEVRCYSEACLRACPDGRVLFRRRADGIFSFKHRGRGYIGITPLIVPCRCGYVWENPEEPERVRAIKQLAMETVR